MKTTRLVWKVLDLYSYLTCYLYPFPLKWNRDKQILQSITNRSQLIRWYLAFPLLYLPYFIGCIVFCLKTIQTGRSPSTDRTTFYIEVLIIGAIMMMGIVAFCFGVTYCFLGKELVNSFNVIKGFALRISKDSNLREIRTSESVGGMDWLGIGLFGVVLYGCGALPHVSTPQLIMLKLDPGFIILKSIGLTWILDESNGMIWYGLVKLVFGAHIWMALVETFRMSILYSILMVIIPVMLNSCMKQIQEQYREKLSLFHVANKSRTIGCIRMYSELQIATQAMAQPQALGCTAMLAISFILIFMSNFVLIRESGFFPVNLSFMILSGGLTSMFSVYVCMQVAMTFHESSAEAIKRWRDTNGLFKGRKYLQKRSLALKPIKWHVGTGLFSHNLCVMDRQLKKKYFLQILDRTITALLVIPG
jgi:hypothetical protein